MDWIALLTNAIPCASLVMGLAMAVILHEKFKRNHK